MMFTNPAEHLASELQRLTLLLHREILRLRASYQLSLDEFRGLYLSDEQVDRLVDQILRAKQADGNTIIASSVAELTDRAEAMRTENAARLNADLTWVRLV